MAGKKGHGDHGKKSEIQTITGEVMDMFCYLSHGASGSKHASCAQQCIKKGIPVGIKVKDGKLYLAVGSDHNAANDMLGKYGGKIVTVTGTVKEKDGYLLLAVKTVKEKK